MESFEELSDAPEEETSKKPQASSRQASVSWRLKAKDIRGTSTQNYFIQTKQTENILIQVAFSVGLGSIWRYPYLCQQNGGGTFILIHFFMLLSFGIPLLYMEMILGQWLRVDNIGVWKKLAPWLGGVGYASILVCILVSLYNSSIVSWSLFYLSNSFRHPLPWDHCPQVKNINVTGFSCLQTVPHQYFWYHTTLSASSNIEEGIDALVLNLSMGIFAAWLILFLIMITGIPTSMPLLVFSVFLPYVLLLCFFIRGLFLEGAVSSLRRMVTTELSALATLDLWRQAGGHVLYSLSLGMGTIITFSSYKAGSHNGSICVKKNVLMLTKLIVSGVLPQDAKPPENILLMPPLNYLDWINNLPPHLQYQIIHHALPCSIKVQTEKIMEGPGLAYAAFSQAVSLFPGSSFWAIVFFLALLITELGTLIRLLEGIILPLQNNVSIFKKYPSLAPVLVCLGSFLSSLIFSSHSGSYILSLFNDQLAPLMLIIIVTFQNVALTWIYGTRRFREELYGQLGRMQWPTFSFLWSYVTLPGLLVLLIICLMKLHQKVTPFYIAWNSSMHWWHTQDPVISDTLEKQMSFKKTTKVPPRSIKWPKRSLEKSTLVSQHKGSESSLKETTCPSA
uniref:Transporter n=1 Tax=Otolemur garnettii TaxID=30611 RepID=H0XMS4_OTOGA